MKANSPFFQSLLLSFILAGTLLQTESAQAANDKKRHGVESSVVITAPPEVVFEHIQLSRNREPGRRKLLSHENATAIIEECFADLPVIGSAKCTYSEVETPAKRVEYHMISSDKLKSFEGAWELLPLEAGQKTLVKLNSYTEPKIPFPFARELASSSTLKDVKRRLHNLKTWTEEAHHSGAGVEPGLHQHHTHQHVSESSHSL